MAQIICALLVLAMLGGCSAVKLAYNNLPEIAYWWVDGYVELQSAQKPRVRRALADLLAWHRREELPAVIALVRQAGALAPRDVTPEQVCEAAESIRARLLAVAVRAEPAAAELALSLDEAQLWHLQGAFRDRNAQYQDEWLDRPRKAQQDKRYELFVKRSEEFYGRLSQAQRTLLRERVESSIFDPAQVDADRRERQRAVLAVLRQFKTVAASPAEARAAIHALVLEVAQPAPGPRRARQQALLQEGCRDVAALHNLASPEQRQRAVRRLAEYEEDFRTLAAD